VLGLEIYLHIADDDVEDSFWGDGTADVPLKPLRSQQNILCRR